MQIFWVMGGYLQMPPLILGALGLQAACSISCLHLECNLPPACTSACMVSTVTIPTDTGVPFYRLLFWATTTGRRNTSATVTGTVTVTTCLSVSGLPPATTDTVVPCLGGGHLGLEP